MEYNPGLHLLANVYTQSKSALIDAGVAKKWWLDRALSAGLHVVGEVFHSFSGGGFTGIIGLTESHISIHTWPEFGYITLDIYLSNHTKANEGISRALLHDYLQYVGAHKHEVTESWR